jgi:hypothetical protein
MSDKIELKEKIAFVDLNVRAAWDEMTEEQRKSLKNEFYILNRYISSAQGQKREVQEHFVLTVNEYFNKHWFELQKNHPKLMWLLLCMCSYDGEKTFYHNWLGNKRKDSTNKKEKLLEELYPNKRSDEIAILASINDLKEIKDLARSFGMDEATIAKKLK